MQVISTVILAAAAVAPALAQTAPNPTAAATGSSNSTNTILVTRTVTAYETYCPVATEFTEGGHPYTATVDEWVTVTNCPSLCTISYNPAAPTVLPAGVPHPYYNATAPVAGPGAVAGAPGVVAPGVVAPGVVAPGVVAPGVVAPGVVAPGVVAPGVVAPGVVAPTGAGAPGAGNGAPGAVAPGSNGQGSPAGTGVAPGMTPVIVTGAASVLSVSALVGAAGVAAFFL